MNKTTTDSSLKLSIGGFRSRRAGSATGVLPTNEVLRRLLVRVEELEADRFDMIGALQSLGMDRCDTSRVWYPKNQLIYGGDRCQCVNEFNPDHFFSEEDEEAQGFSNLVEVMKQISQKGHNALWDRFPKTDLGLWKEPYLSAYQEAMPALNR